MDERIASFLQNLATQGKSQNTIDAYRRDLKKFEAFLKKESLTLEGFEELQIVSYTQYLMETGISKASIIRNMVTLRNFYKFLRRQGYVHEAPILYHELPHLERQMPEVLTVEQINRILEAPSEKTHKGRRDRAILELLYASGLKVSELIQLKLDDVHLTDAFLVCVGAKGKERIIPIGRKAVDSLRNYLEIRSRISKEESDFLFTSQQGASITRQGVWKLLKTYKDQAGIEKEVTLNTLRHSFAVHLLDNGADAKSVQEMLGHSDLQATLRYEELKKKKKLLEIYQNAHPRA
ncbi:Site-specific tyrosine recombinase XerD [Clostridiaceae bacterium JG1575]|nr:Site-specific tyrosine recombinase XerD [Clostridiaceae bacterium JG1575]